MKKFLHISDDVSIPLEAVTNTHLIPARRRVGKTYTAAVMAEEMVEAGLPWVALDPTGVWWGLTSSADGKSEGLPVIIIGGPHGHIPLEPSAGKVIANLVVDNPGWYVIDFSRFDNDSDERKFSAAFGVQLYRRKQRQPSVLHLFLDEADRFVPQKLPKDGKSMFDAYDAIVRRGGVYGLGVTLITQRPALVNKDVSTQCETLIALQTSAPQDQDPILDWVSRNGTPEQLSQIKRTLASLKVGQAWYFSPNTDTFQLIKIRERKTFNSSATPKPGAKPIEPKVFADIDITKLGEEIAATVERTQRDDPEYLRRKIAQLEHELRNIPAQEHDAHIERVEIPVISKDEYESIMSSLVGIQDMATKVLRLGDDMRDFSQLLGGAVIGIAQRVKIYDDAIENITIRKSKDASKDTPLQIAVKQPATPAYVSEGLTNPQQRILDSLAWLLSVGLRQPKRTVVAFLSNQSPRSSGFTNNLGTLRSAGLITYPSSDSLDLTDVGMKSANKPSAPITTEELQASILSRLPRPQANILSVLIKRYPSRVSRETVAEIAGQSFTSSGFTNNLGALRSLGVIDYPDAKSVVALPVLFLE